MRAGAALDRAAAGLYKLRMPTPLHILAEGDRWVAVAKPPALLTHRTPRFALDAALQRLRDQLGQRVYPVHRLDRLGEVWG